MFIDASAITAILAHEPERNAFLAAIDAPGKKFTSVLAVWETTVALARVMRLPMNVAEQEVQSFLDTAEIIVLPNVPADLPDALQAYDRYGRHRYPDIERNKALNLADCFHYASTKAQGAEILTKDAGFALTDLPTVAHRNT